MTKLKSIALAAFASVALFAVSAHAKERVKVDVPFDFVAGGANFQAGSYLLTVPQGDLGLLEMTARGSGKTVFLSSDGVDKSNGEFKLIFSRSGDQRILNAVSTGSNVYHLAERHTSQNVARTPAGTSRSESGPGRQ